MVWKLSSSVMNSGTSSNMKFIQNQLTSHQPQKESW